MSTSVKSAKINGVNVTNLVSTVGAVKDNPRLGGYTFFAETEWKGGAVSETAVKRFVKQESGKAEKTTAFTIAVDEPEGLLGSDTAANPVETLLAGLASCLVIGISYNAAARNIKLDDLRISLEGNINLEGFLGLKDDVRPGYESLQLQYHIRSAAAEEDIADLIRHVEKTSPALDIVTNPVPVYRSLDLNAS